jgi:hypothetical protein
MCALYGKSRDISLFRTISREVVNDIIEQEVGYYKVYLNSTKVNIYGESQAKSYVGPVLLKCLIIRGDQASTTQDYGPDRNRDLTVAFLRDDLIPYELVPELGDVVLWNKDYYEVDNLVENQLIVGKDPNYAITDYLDQFGSDFSIILNCHYTRPEKLNIEKVR